MKTNCCVWPLLPSEAANIRLGEAIVRSAEERELELAKPQKF